MDAALFHEPRRRMFRLRDGEMAALDFGDAARPIEAVFVHANGFNAATYRSILGPLSLSMRILACDLRGHGASRLPTKVEPGRSWRVYRDDLLGLIEALEAPPLILAGHSLGATVALLAADAAPKRVKALSLFDPVVLSPLAALYAKAPWTAGRSLKRLPIAIAAARRRRVFDSALDALQSYSGRGAFSTWPEIMLADYLSAGLQERPDGRVELVCAPTWEAATFAAQDNDARGALARVHAPTTIHRAERRSTCQLGSGAGLMRRNRALHIVTVPETSHFLPMERPDVVREVLLDAAES
jgi:pimeloyl-ACP methyl ester carboxylesterase